MAFGDPINHAHVDGPSQTNGTLTLTWATTSGDTLIVGVRRGGGLGTTTTVTVSWDGGTTFPSTMTLVASQNVVNAGGLFLFYLPNITGASASQTVVKVTFDAAATMRFAVAEYAGIFSLDQQNSADNGSTTAIDSGAITTTATAALIGVLATGLDGATVSTQSSPFVAGTSGSLTWAIEDELDHPNGSASDVAMVIANQSGGGSIGAGTYHLVGTIHSADNTGGIVASFTNAAGGVTLFVNPNLWQIRGPGQQAPASRPFAFQVYVPRGQLQATSVQQAGLNLAGNQSKGAARGFSAALSFAGSIPSRAMTRALSAALTLTGSTPGKAITRGINGGLTFAGTVAKATARKLPPGALAFAGSLSKQGGKTLSGALHLTGSIPGRAITRAQAAALTLAGSIPGKAIGRGLQGAVTVTGSQQKAVRRLLTAASLAFSGALTSVKNGGSTAYQQTLTAGLTFSGTLTKSTSRVLSAGLTFAGQTAKQTTRRLSGALSFAGSIPSRAITRAQAAALTFTGSTPGKAISRILSGSLSFSGNQTKAVRRILTAAALSFSGAISTVKNGGSHAYQQTLTAGVTLAGTIQRSTTHGFTAGLAFSGTQTKAITRKLSATLSSSGTLAASRLHTMILTAGLALSGSLPGRAIGKAFSASATFTGSQRKAITRPFAAVLTPVGQISKGLARSLFGGFSLSGLLSSVKNLLVGPGTVAVSDVPLTRVALSDQALSTVALSDHALYTVAVSDGPVR